MKPSTAHEAHIVHWYAVWHYLPMRAKKRMKKVTLELPSDLLERAMESSQQGIAGTVRQALELLTATVAYEKLRKLREKVAYSLDVKALRND